MTLDIENPNALRKYYDLLLSVIHVIVSAVFSRGLDNQQILEQTRTFLTENRQNMVGIFKRHTKIGDSARSETNGALDDLIKSYVALITAVGFVEVCLLALKHLETDPDSCSSRKTNPVERIRGYSLECSAWDRRSSARR